MAPALPGRTEGNHTKGHASLFQTTGSDSVDLNLSQFTGSHTV